MTGDSFRADGSQMELQDLRLVRSMCEGNLPLYIETLTEIAEWCFSLDHFNYERWLPVHSRDLLTLELKQSYLYKLFVEVYFVVAKTQNAFSMIAPDHNHEKDNKNFKATGGVLGLTENESALRRWSGGPSRDPVSSISLKHVLE